MIESSEKFSVGLKSYIESRGKKSALKKLEKKVALIQERRENYRDTEDLSTIRERLQARLDRGNSLEDILPDAFAVVIEAISRVKPGIELTPSQILTSLVLHEGDIPELATGEGKTYALTMAAFLNTFNNHQVHVFTANDYLAERDCETVAPIFESLGLKVGYALDNYVVDGATLDKKESKEIRRDVYKNCDIVYTNSSTIPFDWQLDQQVMRKEDRLLQRPFNFAIVDEVDSVMIDNANTPLIISNSLKNYEQKVNKQYQELGISEPAYDGGIYGEENRQKYITLANAVAINLMKDPKNVFKNKSAVSSSPLYNNISIGGEHLPGTKNYLEDQIKKSNAKVFIDEREKSVSLTDQGYAAIGNLISKLDKDQNEIFHYIQNALYAHCILKENIDYRVAIDKETSEKKIILIDSNTGRDLPSNKFSDGLHQALEAKEGILPKKQSKMNISTSKITHPNFFLKYDKVTGTSGTVSDEITKSEFKDQYKKKIIEIPRFRKKIAVEQPIEVYATKNEKFDAIVEQIIACHEKNQPILVGARDIDEVNQIMNKLKPFEQKPFAEVCSTVFNRPISELNILDTTKLYCYMTGTEFPAKRESRYALVRQVQSLTLPEKEKTPLDRRVQNRLQKKLHANNAVSFETKKEIYRLIYKKEPTSDKEVLNLYTRIKGIPVQTLTAKDTDKEAEIVSQAGRLGAVTIATAIAGRGTDIALGGDARELAKKDVETLYTKIIEAKHLTKEENKTRIKELKGQLDLLVRSNHCDNKELEASYQNSLLRFEAICKEEKALLEPTLKSKDGEKMHEAGKGLYVLGASLNDSIRVDNQLRGRSGRQGSDGESKFVCSLEDSLITRRGNQKGLDKVKQLIKSNPSHKKAIQYVKAAQRANESALASSRRDMNQCSTGLDFIVNAYYDYRNEVLENPQKVLSSIFKTASNLAFVNPDHLDLGNSVELLSTSIFSEQEIKGLSKSELKEAYDQYTSKISRLLEQMNDEKYYEQIKKSLLTMGDLKFTDLVDSNRIERQLSLESMTPNQTEQPDVLLDKIVFSQYNSFKADLMIESAATIVTMVNQMIKNNPGQIKSSVNAPSIEEESNAYDSNQSTGKRR